MKSRGHPGTPPPRRRPLAIDRFKIGSDRPAGEYTSDTAINSAAAYNTPPSVPVNQGFVNGGCSGGTGTTNFTTPAVYYTSQLLNRGTDVAGFDPGASNIAGFYLDYADTGVADDDDSLVIRARMATNQADQIVLVSENVTSTQNTTFLVVTKAEKDYLGGSADRLTYWVNPTDFSSEAAMATSSLATGSFEFLGLQGAASPNQGLVRLHFVGTGGTAAGDVFPVPEPIALSADARSALSVARPIR